MPKTQTPPLITERGRPINPKATRSDTNSSVLAFKPRQLILLSKQLPTTKASSMHHHSKSILLRSVALFLERCGFSKTLKKFLSEASIQKDEMRGTSSFDLEEVFYKYLQTCDNGEKIDKQLTAGDKILKSKNAKEITADDVDLIVSKSKEKKRTKRNSDSIDEEQVNTEEFPKPAIRFEHESPDKKHKEKKKKYKKLDSLPGETEEKHRDVVASEAREVIGSEKESILKDKKKKKKKPSSDPVLENVEERISDGKQETDAKTSKEDKTENNKMDSRKRKRLVSEEDGLHPTDKNGVEESKRIKRDGIEETKGNDQPSKSSLISDEKTQKEESKKTSSNQYLKVPNKEFDSQANENLEKNIENSASHKISKKQLNGLDEPQTAKRFQRVKVDEVVFSDERLKDNSYWAKDGAEVGYGAKAEEILGQVRGRGFRHEKTKKKRGTYRGGQIDLHSHSIKFNYSDDD